MVYNKHGNDVRCGSQPNKPANPGLGPSAPPYGQRTVELLEISQRGVSKQHKVLRDVGLVQVRQEAQKHGHELHPEPLAEDFNGLVSYCSLIEERYERLYELLKNGRRGTKP